jgi:hypothetical protein
MNVEAVIAALPDSTLTADETAIIERKLREHHGTIPHAQLLNEIGHSLAIHRRQHRRRTT